MNPSQLNTFIDDARKKGMDDAAITQILQSAGWPLAQIQAALSGLVVPVAAPMVPPVPGPTAPATSHAKDVPPAISALEAALQHVFLWIFTFASTIAISIVSAVLFGGDNDSANSLKTFLVVELVTFTPFLVFFLLYIRKQRQNPALTTNKVWSIITIVLHSIGLIGFAIGFLLTVLLTSSSSSSSKTSILVATAVLALMNAIVVITYVAANFVKPSQAWRQWAITFSPALLFIIVATFGVMALSQLGTATADQNTRKHLTSAVQDIHNYGSQHKALPSSLEQAGYNDGGVTYSRTNNYMYKVCADFKRSTLRGYNAQTDSTALGDDYVSDYDFEVGKSGNHCFSFQNYELNDEYLNNTGSSTVVN